jgi:hypothetical protein
VGGAGAPPRHRRRGVAVVLPWGGTAARLVLGALWVVAGLLKLPADLRTAVAGVGPPPLLRPA